ncbi:hypothetical protein GXB85_04640 [Cellulomonas sp. APG4]|uniref:DUF7341 domain-containing protein n=1 Tax=Cellulomonas sp. APG4 TaxID=1538656 RepID=UPI00137A0021|nr:hypothetical protein [Cellulomonas sp. APG4]NCT90241.1 hypothetical protein [Cellulomonas sp. APG4]
MTTHAQTKTDDRAAGQVLTQRIQDRVDDLTRPSTTREHQPVWNRAKGRFDHRPHVVEHPSLVEQLERAVGGTTGPSNSAGAYESKPAARMDALDALTSMKAEAARVVSYLLREQPRALVPNLQLLAARAHDLDADDLRYVDALVLGWWGRARVTTGWDSPAWRPHVRCMACDRLDSLRVRTEPLVAACLSCGAAWDASNIGILGNHIQIALADPIDQTDTRDAAS